MAKYSELTNLMCSVDPRFPQVGFSTHILPYLVRTWLAEYLGSAQSEIIETRASNFSYLFDITVERLIAAWGISAGKNTEARPKERMKHFPLTAGPDYHRGHAIPHTLGGPTDINLVPQLASVNIGRFRLLEKEAVASPGSLYFTYWKYEGLAHARGGRSQQTPTGVDQGLLVPGKSPKIDSHEN
jgi:hypothetical protein